MKALLIQISSKIDSLNEHVGRSLNYLNLIIVLITFTVVVLRYFFHVGWIWMQDIALYCHAAIFLMASAYTYKNRFHVKIDILYNKLSKQNQKRLDTFGTFALLLPSMGTLFYLSYPYVMNSWKVFEGSQDSGGIQGVYLLKTFILVFCTLLNLQGISEVIKIWTKVKRA